MPADARHPLYNERLSDWTQMDDTFEGEKQVKAKSELYLKPTSGMIQDGMDVNGKGYNAYIAYKSRSVYHNVVKDAVEALIGVMHRKPPLIELPEGMKALMTVATPDGESLPALLRRINTLQLRHGRLGLLAEAPDGKTVDMAPLPFIATYAAKTVINWDGGTAGDAPRKLEMVVLDETGLKKKDVFDWDTQPQFRVCVGGDTSLAMAPQCGGEYAVAVVKATNATPEPSQFIQPQIGGLTSKAIPFTFINTNDLVPEPDQPPLLDLSNLGLTIYRGEADFRQTLFLQGQETLVVINATDESKKTRVGAGAVLHLEGQGSDAKYVGVSAAGLAVMRETLNDDKQEAGERGARLLDVDGDGGVSSGEALRIRVSARTTTLTSVARAGAEGLSQCLRQIAEWMGFNPDEVKVEPNLDFATDKLKGQDFLYLMQAKKLGFPLSLKSLHKIAKSSDATDLSYEDEVDAIEDEAEDTDIIAGGLGAFNTAMLPKDENGDPIQPGPALKPGEKKPAAAKKPPPAK